MDEAMTATVRQLNRVKALLYRFKSDKWRELLQLLVERQKFLTELNNLERRFS